MSFRVVRQRDTMQCGIACLQMICLYYNYKISYDNISQHCSVSRNGLFLGDLCNTALSLGFDASCRLINFSDLDNDCLPCIIHWQDNHFVVLYKIKNNRYYIADPSKGKYIFQADEFKENWAKDNSHTNGVVLLLFPTKNLYSNNYNAKNVVPPSSLRFLISVFAQYKRYFLIVVLGLTISCIIQLLLPFFSQAIVDIGISERDLSIIWLIMIGEMILVIGNVAIEFTRKWLLLHISMRINISMLREFFIKLFKLPMLFFESRLLGDILQRMADHSRIEEFLTIKFLSASFSVFSFIVFGTVLFIYNKAVFFVYILGSIIYGVWVSCFLRERRFIDYELFDRQATNKDITYALISNMQEIKLQGCENRRRYEWEKHQVGIFNTQMKSLKLNQWQESGSVLINQTKNLLTTIIAATSVIDGELTLGMMLSIQFIVGQLETPIEQFLMFINSFQDVKISLERIGEVHCRTNEETELQDNISKTDLALGISFEHVSYRYNLQSKIYAVKDVSFNIPYKKTTAIVGASGSGKSTILKLILGFYALTEGSISIGNKQINKISKKSLRKLCGVVMQNGAVFSESIARNIAIEDGEINYTQLKKASETAQLDGFINSLPLKYETLIGSQGIGLSQGQKQRILIARAIYKCPEIIILDEATNSLDATNERKISDALFSLYKDKTVIIVAHRLSTVKNADQIIVLDHGMVSEIGNHNSLLQNKGVYYNLVINQLNIE